MQARRLRALLVIGALLVSLATAAAQAPSGPSTGTGYPAAATAVENSASGTTGAVTATLPAVVGKTTYLCGFSYQGSDATAAQAGSVSVTGTISGTMNFAYPTLALGVAVPQPGPLTVPFSPCMPASGQNSSIAVAGPALGAGATVATVNAWGYQKQE